MPNWFIAVAYLGSAGQAVVSVRNLLLSRARKRLETSVADALDIGSADTPEPILIPEYLPTEDILFVGKTAVAELTLGVVEDGYVASRTDESDHRAHLLKLTAKGREVFDSTLPKMRERQRRLRAELSEQDLAALHRAFDALELAADWRDDEGEG